MQELFKVLGDTNRLRILNLLRKGEFCVCEIEVILDMTQSNVSRHLNKLKSSDIISSTKAAQWVHYKVSETFINNNKLLYSYLIDGFEGGLVFKGDIEKLNKYRDNDFSCKVINEDKERVLGALNERRKDN